MANDLVGSNADRGLLMQAMSGSLSTDLGGDPNAALAILDDMMVPLKTREPLGQAGERTNRLANSLRLLGAKIAPTMSEEQVQVWLAAMTAALSDLPARVSIRACEDAIHSPMRFLNEVEGVVREKADEVAARYRLAKHRLEALKRDLAAVSTPKLEGPARMLSDEELQQMPDELRRIGIGAGWLAEDETGTLTWKDQA